MHRSLTTAGARRSFGAVLLLALAAALAPARAGGEPDGRRLTFQADPRSRVHIAGRATIGAWECETAEVIAIVEPGPHLAALARHVTAGGRVEPDAIGGALPDFDPGDATAPFALITIPTASLRPDKPGMRRDVLRALRADDAPLIVFSLTGLRGLEILPRGAGELGRYRVAARGQLILAGRKRQLELLADVVQISPSQFRIAATQTIRMTEFGIAPPTAFFGLIRTDETVTVRFDLTLNAIGDGVNTAQFSDDPAPGSAFGD